MSLLIESAPPQGTSIAAPRPQPAVPAMPGYQAVPYQQLQRACCASCASGAPCDSEHDAEAQDPLGESLQRAVQARAATG
jgi:hypothetical protein